MQRIDEVKRFQKLAGILTEVEGQTDPVADKDAKQGLEQALLAIKKDIPSLKPSPKDGQLEESIALSLIIGAPGIAQVLGKGVNLISSFFQKDKKKGTVVGNAMVKWGEKLEHTYLDSIGEILRRVFPNFYKNQDVNDVTSKLHDHARAIYFAMLAATGIKSGLEAAESVKLIGSAFHGADALVGAEDMNKLAVDIAKA
jgi:hypothetical protein